MELALDFEAFAGRPLPPASQSKFVGGDMSLREKGRVLRLGHLPKSSEPAICQVLRRPKQVHFCTAVFKKKYLEMLWVILVIYPVFLALIFHECFFNKKRYFFQDVATNWAPLYYCVIWYVNKEGYATMRRAKGRLIRLFLQRIARPRNKRI